MPGVISGSLPPMDPNEFWELVAKLPPDLQVVVVRAERAFTDAEIASGTQPTVEETAARTGDPERNIERAINTLRQLINTLRQLKGQPDAPMPCRGCSDSDKNSFAALIQKLQQHHPGEPDLVNQTAANCWGDPSFDPSNPGALKRMETTFRRLRVNEIRDEGGYRITWRVICAVEENGAPKGLVNVLLNLDGKRYGTAHQLWQGVQQAALQRGQDATAYEKYKQVIEDWASERRLIRFSELKGSEESEKCLSFDPPDKSRAGAPPDAQIEEREQQMRAEERTEDRKARLRDSLTRIQDEISRLPRRNQAAVQLRFQECLTFQAFPDRTEELGWPRREYVFWYNQYNEGMTTLRGALEQNDLDVLNWVEDNQEAARELWPPWRPLPQPVAEA
jgi:hypothetical protein